MYKSLNLVTVIILLIVLNLNPIFLSGQTAKVFEAGVLSLKDRVEFGCTFSPDGKEFYFSLHEVSFRVEFWIQPSTFNVPTSIGRPLLLSSSRDMALLGH